MGQRAGGRVWRAVPALALVLLAWGRLAARVDARFDTLLVSRTAAGAAADDESTRPAVSADGRHVAFSSAAENLSGADAQDTSDEFVRDMVTGAVTRVSRAIDGTGANAGAMGGSISADGRYVVFWSTATT